MERSVVYLENIWAEDLFKWFYEHVMDSCGDGGGAIVCKNYREVSDWFVEWWKSQYNEEKFFRPKDEYHNIINYHDGDESFIFTNEPDLELFYHDYIFVVRKDCSSYKGDKVILPI